MAKPSSSHKSKPITFKVWQTADFLKHVENLIEFEKAPKDQTKTVSTLEKLATDGITPNPGNKGGTEVAKVMTLFDRES